MNNIYFVGQPKFGSAPNQSQIRSAIWDDTETMNNDLISYWNESINTNDTVYVLGEFFDTTYKNQDDILFQLNGNILFLYNKKDALHKYTNDNLITYTELEFIYQSRAIYLTNFLEHINNIETNFIVTSCDTKLVELKNENNLYYTTSKGSVHFLNNLKSPVYNVCIDYNNFRPFKLEDIYTSYINYIRINI